MLPLNGIRVVDITRFISGPFCAMYLGDLGADVIKIEHPRDGDGTRRWGSGPHAADNPYYLSVNRSKRSLGLDLKHPQGLKILEQLIAKSDVLLTNSIPGTLDEMGLGAQRLREINPRLVSCQITGFGDKGPDSQRGAFDFTVQAESGLMSLVGEPEGAPMKVGAPILDVLSGLNACVGVLASLMARQAGGEPMKVSTSMIETAICSMPNIVSDYLVGGLIPQRHGNAHPNLMPYEIYETSDRWLALGMGNEPQWARFCELTGRADLKADPRFKVNTDRLANRDVLNEQLKPIFAAHPLAWWQRALADASIPCAAVNSVPDALASAQVQALDIVRDVPHPLYGSFKMARSPISLDDTPLEIKRPPPCLGQHTDEVLTQVLGLSAAQIAQLREARVVAGAAVG